MNVLAVAIAVCALLLVGAAVFFFRRSLAQRTELRRLGSELERLRQVADRVDVDPLTELANRAALTRWLEEQHGFHGWVVVCDLDDFKALNDKYGHMAGDEILRGAGQLIAASIRSEDRAYRWGGDEFVVFFSSSERPVVEARLRAIEKHLRRFHIRNHGPVPICLSWGMAPVAGRPLKQCVEEADWLMLEAKRNRRNSQAGGPA
jgi:diguanylate cyclase (GGDEF)-like protein